MNDAIQRKNFQPVLVLVVGLMISSNVDTVGNPSFSGLEERAEKGDVRAALSLGMKFRDGDGVEQDDREAMRWYRVSADQGDPQGMDNVGYMYLRGKGVPQNEEVAVAFFRTASEKGNSQATYNLGECYFSGQGVEQNYSLAVETWTRAAEVGHQNAKWRLAMIYASGEFVPRNEEKSEALCRELAKKDHSNAMLLLGEICDRRGDLEEARSWWQKASDLGNPQGKDLLEIVHWKDASAVAGEHAYVDVDHLYQGWNNCGATTMSMFLRQAGGSLTPYDVKRHCPSPIGTGTDWQHLVAVAPEAKQDWKLITFPYTEKGFDEGLTEIQSILDQELPVVIDFTYVRIENGEEKRNGHTLLVVGYHKENDQIVLKNPNQPAPGIQLMTAEELKKNWYSSGYSRSAKGKTARPLIVHVP